MEKTKLIFVVNILSVFISHRLAVATEALKTGYDVTVVYGEKGRVSEQTLANCNLNLIHIPIARNSTNPLKDCRVIFELFLLFRKIKPNVVHLITFKPMLYGGLAAFLAQVPAVVFAVTGMGSVFIGSEKKMLSINRLITALFRFVTSITKNNIIIFQNQEDAADLLGCRSSKKENIRLIPGMGVNLDEFFYVPPPTGVPVITFLGRFLKDKGIMEFVDAAKILKERGVTAKFCLVGSPDPMNSSSLTLSEMKSIKDAGTCDLLGFREDVHAVYSKSNIVCLPSYREGFPKSLIEAAATGRAIVTTDVPGCKDVVIANTTGLLSPARHEGALADALQFLVENPDICLKMGIRGRAHAEKNFSSESVVSAHLAIYRGLTLKTVAGLSEDKH